MCGRGRGASRHALPRHYNGSYAAETKLIEVLPSRAVQPRKLDPKLENLWVMQQAWHSELSRRPSTSVQWLALCQPSLILAEVNGENGSH